MAARSYELREHPTMEVEIGGRAYRARLGDMTFSLLAREALRLFPEIAGAGSDEERVDRAVAFSDAARACVACVLGPEAAEELVGGDHRLDMWRIADVLSAVCDIVSSDEYLEASRGAWSALS